MNIEILQGQPVVRLQSGAAQALISPAHGAKLLAWRLRNWTVIDWPGNADWDRVTKVRGGNPVLFPFIARTFLNGRIGSWIDAQGVVRPAPMHGFAKDSPFRVVEGAEDFVTLRLDANDTTLACFPFAFRFEVTHRLAENSLQTTFRVTNLGDQPLPWSAGHHYYFHIPATERPDWQLDLPCARWARQDFSSGTFSFQPSVCRSARLSDPAWIDRLHDQPVLEAILLQHAPSGRSISFANPDARATDWPCVTTWTEKPDSDFFCVEPWSAFPNAIHNSLGLRTLALGMTDEISCLVHADIRS